jgi:signal transduction histidine kinase
MMRFSHTPAKNAARNVDSSPQSEELATVEMAFLGSLLPGIIHNMATPLSGVLGATQLLEHRAEQIRQLMASGQNVESEQRDLLAQLERNKTNVEILSRNAQHLADILHTLVQRINHAGSGLSDFYAINELIQSEVRFLDSNLHFKHRVKKELDLQPDLPSVPFVYGHLAALVDEFVCYAIAHHDVNAGSVTMRFTTRATDNRVELVIEADFPHQLATSDGSELLTTYLGRFQADGWRTSVTVDPMRLTLNMNCAAKS